MWSQRRSRSATSASSPIRSTAPVFVDPATAAVADEVAQPANNLLLHERTDRPGVPDVDALLGDLGEDLAGDRCDERRRREIAEGPRVVRARCVWRDPVPELVEHIRKASRPRG